MAELPNGTVVAGCRIEGIVGRGGMGVVYRATQLSLERRVALKAIVPELADDVGFRERFKRESRLAASIEHPNVIPVYEAGESEGVLYLTMRYIEGTDLRALIDAEGGLDPERAARIVAQVASALSAAHRRGLIHRDVKPANVLIDAGGEPEHAYLTDFGIARHAAATAGLTRSGAVIGTLDYLAPERIQDRGGDGRSDVYALGCVLFEALTGGLPYERENDVAKMYAHLTAPVPSARERRPDLPAELDEITSRAMAKEPDRRFASATVLAEALTDALPGRRFGTGAAPIPSAPPSPGPARAPLGLAGEAMLEAATAEEELSPAERAAERDSPDTGEAVPAETPAGADEGEPGPTAVTEPVAAGESEPRQTAFGEPTAAGEPEPGPTAVAAPAPQRAHSPGRPAAPPAPSGRRSSPVVIGAALAAAAGAALVLLLASGGGGDDPAPERTPTQRAQTRAPQPPPAPRFAAAGTFAIPPGTDGMAAGFGRLWIANKQAGTLTAAREASGTLGEPIAVGTEPDSVAVGFGSVWVTSTLDDTVTRIDPDGGAAVTIDVGDGPEGIAVSKDAVWVANGTGNSVTRISPGDGSTSTQPVGREPVQLAVTGDDRVWVTLSGADRVVEIDPRTGKRTGAAARVAGQPRGIAFGAGRLWVSALETGRLWYFEPGAPERIRRMGVPAGPREVRFGLGAVWVNSSGPGVLTAIDPARARRIRSFAVGPQNYGLAVSKRFAWSASLENGRLLKLRRGG